MNLTTGLDFIRLANADSHAACSLGSPLALRYLNSICSRDPSITLLLLSSCAEEEAEEAEEAEEGAGVDIV